MSITTLARPEIRALRCYTVAAPPEGAVRLNANEAPQAIGNGGAQGLNRYPAIRPTDLTASLAGHYGVGADDVLVTRGSSEGIDLLVRAFCSAGQDSVLVTPPRSSFTKSMRRCRAPARSKSRYRPIAISRSTPTH